MKLNIFINNLVVLLPIALALIGFIDNGFWSYALLSTIITGFTQVIIALFYIVQYPRDKHIYIYFIGVVMFFALWIVGANVDYICFIPPVLAFYLTFILYNNKKVEQHEP